MRHVFVGFLIGALLCGSAGAAEWYAPYVDVALREGLMEGTGDGFQPNRVVTVGELYAAAARLARHHETGSGTLEPAPDWYWAADKLPDGTPLRDTVPPWALDACYHLANLQGYPTDTSEFLEAEDPRGLWTAPADRFALAGVLLRAYGLEMERVFAETGEWGSGDVDWGRTGPVSLSDTAHYDALSLVGAGIMTGVDGQGTFDGGGTVTRAQLGAVLARFVEPELRAGPGGRTDAEFQGFTLTPFPVPEGYDPIVWFYHSNGDDRLRNGQYLHVRSSEGDWEDRKEGVVDIHGAWVVPPVYADIWPFQDTGYADAWKRGGCCDRDYVDGKGNALPELPAPEGPVPYWDQGDRGKDGAWLAGYKNSDGTVLVPPEYDGAWGFSEGLGVVGKDGLWGFVDESGELAIPLQFPYETGEDYYLHDMLVGLFRFREGYAIVTGEDGEGWYRYGVIDKTGRQVLPCVYDYLDLCYEGRMAYGRDGVYGYVDPATGVEYPVAGSGYGVTTSDPFWRGLGPFSDGYAPVELYLEGFPHQWEPVGTCYVDREGRAVTPPIFYAAGTVQDGKAIVFWGERAYLLSFEE